MKSLILALSLAVASTGLILPGDAEAKRLGGGGSSGMQRSMPSRAPDSLPARPPQAAPTTPPPAGVPAAAPRRSWMGPIAGLAAGLGIAALMSHLGLGAGFGNVIMMVLLGLVAFAAIRFLMRRFAGNGPIGAARGGMQYAGASSSGAPVGGMPAANGGALNGGGSGWAGNAATQPRPAAQGPLPTVTRLPAGFDAAGFERIAKMIFIRMQTANDRSDLDDLRAFTTPEMFASVRLELQERGNAVQVTDVVRVDAEVLEVVAEADRQVVSVRFHGLIREEQAGPTVPFDEIWHLVKPTDGSREWAIAGIQQAQLA